MRDQIDLFMTRHEAQKKADDAWIWGLLSGIAFTCVMAGIVFIFGVRPF